jgi:hypothetical protein
VVAADRRGQLTARVRGKGVWRIGTKVVLSIVVLIAILAAAWCICTAKIIAVSDWGKRSWTYIR